MISKEDHFSRHRFYSTGKETITTYMPTVKTNSPWIKILPGFQRIWPWMMAICLLFPVSGALPASGPQLLGPENFSRVAEMAGRAVVNIRTEKSVEGGGTVFRHYFRGPEGSQDQFNPFLKDFLGDESNKKYKEQSLGSGFFFDPFGHIVTNYHVVEGAERIKVRLKNGKEFDGEVVGIDPFTDLALISINSQWISPVIPLGNSDNLEVGEWVAAIGSPFGLEQTVTVGIVSAKGRVVGMGAFDDFIQTDASINPGNSGGPLLNVKGEVIGVNTAIALDSYGIGFAIPINLAENVILQLRESGQVSRGWLGVVVQDIDESIFEYLGLKEKKGVLVSEVYEGNPADEAGIEINDVILEINNRPVNTRMDMPRIVSSIRVGSDIEMKIFRKGRTDIYTVRVSRREDIDLRTLKPSRGLAHKFGISVSDISPEERQRFQLENISGVLVSQVAPRGEGNNAGIFPGDIIREINHQPVISVDAYKYVIRRIRTGEEVRFLIQRKGVGYLVVKLYK
jgi:serine protease Do